MAKATKTSDKRVMNLKPGKVGVRFSKDNQPPPEAKSKGWRELRAERHLSQAIIKEMLGDNGTPTQSFKEYLQSLVMNAKMGNAKAIEAVNKYIEDDISLLALVDPNGNAVQPTINIQVIDAIPPMIEK